MKLGIQMGNLDRRLIQSAPYTGAGPRKSEFENREIHGPHAFHTNNSAETKNAWIVFVPETGRTFLFCLRYQKLDLLRSGTGPRFRAYMNLSTRLTMQHYFWHLMCIVGTVKSRLLRKIRMKPSLPLTMISLVWCTCRTCWKNQGWFYEQWTSYPGDHSGDILCVFRRFGPLLANFRRT